MDFFLDECLRPQLRDLLNAAGHDAVHVVDRSLQGSTDDEVMAAAEAEGRVLLSSDTDFGELHARGGAATPSVVLFCRGVRTAPDQAAVPLSSLIDVQDDLSAGAIVIVTDDRIRVRRLPI